MVKYALRDEAKEGPNNFVVFACGQRWYADQELAAIYDHWREADEAAMSEPSTPIPSDLEIVPIVDGMVGDPL